MPPSPDLFEQAFADVRDNPGLRRRIEVARAWGVRPSALLDWDDEDLALALALHELEADACPGCGGLLSVTTAPEAEARFVPGRPVRCHRCTALSQAAAIHQTEYHPHAVHYGVRDRALEPDPGPEPTSATGGTEDGEDEPAGDPATD